MRLGIESTKEAREALRAVAEFVGDSFYVVQDQVALDLRDDLHELTRQVSNLHAQRRQP